MDTKRTHSDLIPREHPQNGMEDQFDRTRFSQEIARRLASRAEGIVIGLTGPWGSGKTKTLDLIAQSLNNITKSPSKEGNAGLPPTLVVRFNPWVVSGFDSIVRQFFKVVLDSAKKAQQNKDTPDKLKKQLKSFLDSTSAWIKEKKNSVIGLVEAATKAGLAMYSLPAALVGGLVPGVAGLLEGAPISLEQERAEFLKKVEEAGFRVIVLVDDIDRLSDLEIRDLAKLIKAVADFPQFSYLLAYDPDRVAGALGGENIRLGHQYLEKVVQVQVRLPRVADVDLKRFIEQFLKKIFTTYYREDEDKQEDRWSNQWKQFSEILSSIIPAIIATPRDALRLIAAIEFRLPLVGNEVDHNDLIRYCALEAKIPVLSERLQNLVSRVTVDGSRELKRRFEPYLEDDRCLEDILGEYKQDAALLDLLLILFPALQKPGPELIAQDDGSLCYETSLRTLLNCSPQQGLLDRITAQRILADSGELLKTHLDNAIANDSLRHANLRLRTAARTMQISSDQTKGITKQQVEHFWKKMGSFFDRPMSREEMGKWANWLDLTHVWVRGAMRRYLPKDHHPITKDFTKQLITDGYIHLPARILFFHFQAINFPRVDRDLGLMPFIDPEDMPSLLAAAVEKFSHRILHSLGKFPKEEDKDRKETPKWILRSVYPLWVILIGDSSGRYWQDVVHHLSNPKISTANNSTIVDGIVTLLLRSKEDRFDKKALIDRVDLPSLMTAVYKVKGSDEELRDPVADGYRYLRYKIRQVPTPSKDE